MSQSRRNLLKGLLAASGAAVVPPATAANDTVSFKADTIPERSECGVGALMPFAGIGSLAGSLPVVQKRLAIVCLFSYLLFTGIATHRMVSTDFTLGLKLSAARGGEYARCKI